MAEIQLNEYLYIIKTSIQNVHIEYNILSNIICRKCKACVYL